MSMNANNSCQNERNPVKNGTCFLVGASEIARPFSPREGDFVIAADGGYDRLLPLGVRPDLLIGDMDSIAALPAGIETRLFPVRKDETDLFLAFREGFARGYRAFRLVGAGGGPSVLQSQRHGLSAGLLPKSVSSPPSCRPVASADEYGHCGWSRVAKRYS